MKSFILIVLLINLIGLNAINIIGNYIQFNGSPNCYLAYFDQTIGLPFNGISLYGNATYFPVCPLVYQTSSTTSPPAPLGGYYCAYNFQQSVQLIQLNATQFSLKTAGLGSQNRLLTHLMDSSAGTSNAIFYIQQPVYNPALNANYCFNSTIPGSYISAGTSACLGVPTPTYSSTYCLYQNSVCNIDGICILDSLISSLNLVQIAGYFPGLFPLANSTFTMSPSF